MRCGGSDAAAGGVRSGARIQRTDRSPGQMFLEHTLTFLSSESADDKKDVPVPPVLPKRRGQGIIRRREVQAPADANRRGQGTTRRRREVQAPADAKPDAAAAQNEKFSSIWFSLIASLDQQGDPPLPQIPSHYLRIKEMEMYPLHLSKSTLCGSSVLQVSLRPLHCEGTMEKIQPMPKDQLHLAKSIYANLIMP